MKNALYGVAIAALVSTTALAGGPDMHAPMGPTFRPFVGVNYSYLNVNRYNGGGAVAGAFSGNLDSYNGLGFEAGLKYGQYLGFAWGWNHYFGQTGTVAGVTGVAFDPESYYFDMRGYYPVMPQFNLIGSVGAGWLDVGSTNAAGLNDFNQVNLRLGVGADYYFTPNWGVQGMFHWVPSHGPVTSGYNSYWTVTAGIYYMFS